jgi:hypothetical protein
MGPAPARETCTYTGAGESPATTRQRRRQRHAGTVSSDVNGGAQPVPADPPVHLANGSVAWYTNIDNARLGGCTQTTSVDGSAMARVASPGLAAHNGFWMSWNSLLGRSNKLVKDRLRLHVIQQAFLSAFAPRTRLFAPTVRYFERDGWRGAVPLFREPQFSARLIELVKMDIFNACVALV